MWRDGIAQSGGFIISLYEIFALGLASYLENNPNIDGNRLVEFTETLANQDVLQQFRGRSGGDRLRTTLSMGRELFE